MNAAFVGNTHGWKDTLTASYSGAGALVRASLPQELLVRFEGVAGEFAQFDFGEVSIRLTDGPRQSVSRCS